MADEVTDEGTDAPVWGSGTPLPEQYLEAPADEPDEIVEPEATDDEPAAPAAPAAPDAPAAPAADDPYTEFGGRERVEAALVVAEAYKSEAGLRQVGAEVLKSLGVPSDIITAVLSGQAPAPAGAPAAGDDDETALSDDDVLTVADFKRLMAESLAPVQQTVVAQQEAARQAVADQAVNESLAALGIAEDAQTTQWVLKRAEAYLAPDDWSPEGIKRAVERGHADFISVVEKAQKEYLTKKRETKEKVPKSSGGGGAEPPGGETVPEPKNVAEAIAAARKSLAL